MSQGGLLGDMLMYKSAPMASMMAVEDGGMPPPPPMANSAMEDAGEGAAPVQPARHDGAKVVHFSSTHTDSQGRAVASFDAPETLGAFEVLVWAATPPCCSLMLC